MNAKRQEVYAECLQVNDRPIDGTGVRRKSSSECWLRPPEVVGNGSIELSRELVSRNVRTLVAHSTEHDRSQHWDSRGRPR